VLLVTTSGGVLAVAQNAVPPASATAEVSPLAHPVTVAAGSRTPDAELVELARAAHVNMLADASNMAGAMSVPVREGKLYGNLNLLAKERHLTWRRSGDNTVLAWDEPDVLSLAQRVALTLIPAPKTPATTDAPATTPATVPASPDGTSLNQELTKFFARPEQRGATAQEGWKDAPLVTLPAPLRAQVLDAIRARTSRQTASVDALWLSDDFWKGMRLRIKNIDMISRGPDGQSVKTPMPILFYGNTYSLDGHQGLAMRGLGLAPITP